MTESHQQPLFQAVEQPVLGVVDDYGEVGDGATQARYVRAENGSEYLIKGPSLVTGLPTVAANEWCAVKLAEALGLPVLDHRILSMGGELFFASAWMQTPTFYPAADEAVFRRCRNRDVVYELVVFDAWLCNGDRHAGNLLIRAPRQDSGDHLLLLNDHSHCMVNPDIPTLERLLASLDVWPGHFVNLAFVRSSIARAGRLDQALRGVESLTDDFIRGVVRSTPAKLLPTDHREGYERFLIERRPRLRPLFRRDRNAFPELVGKL